MKVFRKVACLMLALLLICSFPTKSFALSRTADTDFYGTLTGTITQSGTTITTTTSVTENNYNGYLHTDLVVADGNDTTLYSAHYTSEAGKRSMTNYTTLTTIIREVVIPKHVFYCAEIRGGTEEGECLYMTLLVDTSVFS